MHSTPHPYHPWQTYLNYHWYPLSQQALPAAGRIEGRLAPEANLGASTYWSEAYGATGSELILQNQSYQAHSIALEFIKPIDARLNTLDLALSGDATSAWEMLSIVLCDCDNAVLDIDGQATQLPLKKCIELTTKTRSIFEYGNNMPHTAMHLLYDFFHAPQEFFSITLNNINAYLVSQHFSRFTLTFNFKKNIEQLAQYIRWHSNTVSIINRFTLDAEPLKLAAHQLEYPVSLIANTYDPSILSLSRCVMDHSDCALHEVYLQHRANQYYVQLTSNIHRPHAIVSMQCTVHQALTHDAIMLADFNHAVTPLKPFSQSIVCDSQSLYFFPLLHHSLQAVGDWVSAHARHQPPSQSTYVQYKNHSVTATVQRGVVLPSIEVAFDITTAQAMPYAKQKVLQDILQHCISDHFKLQYCVTCFCNFMHHE